jgi:hypothetical protein
MSAACAAGPTPGPAATQVLVMPIIWVRGWPVTDTASTTRTTRAERAKTLRAAQCREGWHLEDEPAITPDPATDDQKWWIETRAEAQQLRDQAAASGQETADFDELLGELDEEINGAGIRGKVAPDKPARRS